MKQPENPLDLYIGTLPIRGGQREKRQCLNSQAGSGFNNPASRFSAGAMSGGAWQSF